MTRLQSFKYFLVCLVITAFFACMYAFFFGIESAIHEMPKHILSSIIGICLIIALLVMIAMVGGEEKKAADQSEATEPVADSNKQEKVTFDDVIVSDELKEDLKVIFDGVSEKMKENFKTLGLTPAQGYLFYGPPGTGKTLLARAIAGEANINFVNISASALVGQFAGHGVERVCNLFEQARKNAPCVIFIDEIDSIGAKRISNSSSVSQDHNKTLIQLLNEMDGFDSNKGITVIAATNRPEALDEALLRRFPEKINIPLPDVSSREKILRLQMGTAPAESGLSLEEVAKKLRVIQGMI